MIAHKNSGQTSLLHGTKRGDGLPYNYNVKGIPIPPFLPGNRTLLIILRMARVNNISLKCYNVKGIPISFRPPPQPYLVINPADHSPHDQGEQHINPIQTGEGGWGGGDRFCPHGLWTFITFLAPTSCFAKFVSEITHTRKLERCISLKVLENPKGLVRSETFCEQYTTIKLKVVFLVRAAILNLSKA